MPICPTLPNTLSLVFYDAFYVDFGPVMPRTMKFLSLKFGKCVFFQTKLQLLMIQALRLGTKCIHDKLYNLNKKFPFLNYNFIFLYASRCINTLWCIDNFANCVYVVCQNVSKFVSIWLSCAKTKKFLWNTVYTSYCSLRACGRTDVNNYIVTDNRNSPSLSRLHAVCFRFQFIWFHTDGPIESYPISCRAWRRRWRHRYQW